MTTDSRARPIHSDYYLGRKHVKTTAAVHASNVMSTAHRHLEQNDYAADRVEIYNIETGLVYGGMRAWLNGDKKPRIETLFEHEGLAAIQKEGAQR